MMRGSSLGGAAALATACSLVALGACGVDITGTLADGDAGSTGDATTDATGKDATADARDDGAATKDGSDDGGGGGDGGPDGARDASADAAADATDGGPCALPDGGAGITCAGTCVDPGNDHEHCGSCVPCAASAACETGACVDVAASLSGLRYEQPCNNGIRPFCGTGAGGSKTAAVTGTTGKSYEIAFRVRGVVEQKQYNNTTAGGATGTNASFFIAAGTPNGDGWNVVALGVSAPVGRVYFNAGASNHSYSDGLDYHATLRANAGATLTLAVDPRDGLEAPNVDNGGTPIVVPGIAPAPNPFDGQFIQLDVESVRALP